MICSLLPSVAMAQDVRYRVEILVLSHLDHDAEPREFHRIDDYSSAVDYLTPPPPPEEGDEEQPLEAAEETEPAPDDPLEAELVVPEIPRLVQVEEMSELMKENWRRLRLSAPFRPLQYLSWEQAEDEPFPALRVHDLEVVLVEDPWAEQRALLEAQTLDAAEPVEDTENSEEPGLPDPIVYYRLDGTVTLRRSRFLHLDIRLDWREPVFAETAPVEGAVDTAPPAAFRVHRLEQSRLVRTDRLEYFDHPVLGVLAYVTRFEVAEEPPGTD